LQKVVMRVKPLYVMVGMIPAIRCERRKYWE
jgi:hypothetical protein